MLPCFIYSPCNLGGLTLMEGLFIMGKGSKVHWGLDKLQYIWNFCWQRDSRLNLNQHVQNWHLDDFVLWKSPLLAVCQMRCKLLSISSECVKGLGVPPRVAFILATWHLLLCSDHVLQAVARMHARRPCGSWGKGSGYSSWYVAHLSYRSSKSSLRILLRA